MASIRETFIQSGRNLRRIRTEKNMSVPALSVLSKVDESTIDTMEAGVFDFPISTLFELAAALNVDFREILVDRQLLTK
ncbi:MAG TPA: helix-turn-helix transcriptional regulator [Mucilaginibacter sp.]|jgi:transcriptional regulator with XRE-family HTH domain|nr:helix-turn-helix transcriptional regulator [Mucilaginibacter sp.]